MLETPLCRALGIEWPILAAPMGFLTGPELAAAISNAGGLGIMSFSGNPPPVLREDIQHLRSLTDRPFGVGVLLGGPHLPFPVQVIVDLCLEERVPVLATFWGDPSPYVASAHAVGVKVIDQVGSVADARRAAHAGVDTIVAQGMEAGGHVAGFDAAHRGIEDLEGARHLEAYKRVLDAIDHGRDHLGRRAHRAPPGFAKRRATAA